MGTVVLADVTELQTKKISELPELASAGGSAVLPVVESGVTQKIEKGNFADLDQILYVAKNGNDSNTGTINAPFLTINAACEYAIANLAGTLTVIKVYPGTYIEQIHSTQDIFIEGAIPTYPINEEKPVILYNTGVDTSHYPLRADDGDYYSIQNMIIRTDAEETFGKVCNSRFAQCRFEGGFFIEGTEDVSVYSTWFDCAFYNCKGFNLTGVAPNSRYFVFERCWFGWNKTATFESTHTVGNAVVDMDGGHLSFTKLSIKGDWYHFAKNYHSYGSVRHEYDTTKGIIYRGVTITNGIHFVSNPASFKIVDCGMEDGAESPIPDGEADITADIAITDVEFKNNSLHNGICGNLRITSGLKDVGSGSRNRYLSLQCAVESVAPGESAVIRVFEDLSDLAEITLPNENVNITINGQKQYSLAFTGDIVEIGDNRKLRFADMAQLSGGNIELNGANAEISFESCQYVTGYITLTAGAFAILYKTSFFGVTGHDAISINNADTLAVVGYSRVQGGAGNPAVNFTVAANSKFKAKYSTFLHGDGGGAYPIIRTGSFSVKFAIYSSAGNNSFLPPAGGLENAIKGPNNTDDPELDF